MTADRRVRTCLRFTTSRLFQASSIAALSLFGGAALAQDAGIEQVTVTGSRITTPGFTAPTPVTAINSQTFERTEASNIGDALNTIPSFRATTTSESSGVSTRGGGTVFADLRGLGTVRTLVLVDGRRFQPSVTTGQVDLNEIPDILIQRAEVVTGGASAAYGSDAVAGVINLILKKDLNGVQGTAHYGVSEHGDNIEYRAAAAGGIQLLDKLHVEGAIEYLQNKGVGDQYTRDWGKKEYGLLTNSAFATNGLPNYIIAPNVRPSNETTGSLVTAGPLKGTQFGPGGVPSTFTYGTIYGNFMSGGDNAGHNFSLGLPLNIPISRSVGYAHADYDITDDISAFVEGSYGWVHAVGASQQSRNGGTLTIRQDNAYLPASIVTAMTANKITTLTIGRIDDDIGHALVANTTQTARIAAGLKGSLPDGWWGTSWKWDGYYEDGQNILNSNIPNNRINARYTAAIDAVSSGGQIVCRSTVTAPTNGCVPFNIFGPDSSSAAARAYVTGTTLLAIHNRQKVAAVNLQGNPFEDWAGPVSLAVGFEARHEQGVTTSDPLSQQVQSSGTVGAYNLGNPQPSRGAYNVSEFFAETVVPLLVDVPYAKNLEFNAAVRRTDYSTSGVVTTWKAGFSYEMNSELRFRGTASSDIRAPNLDELYSGARTTFLTAFDPQQNQTVQIRTLTSGNTNLKPEQANTVTGGVLYAPDWLPGFHGSIDYFNINLKGQISTLGAPLITSKCFAGVTSYCSRIVRDGTGAISYVNDSNLNLGAFKTSGVDFEADYSFELADLIDPSLAGSLSNRLLATMVDHYTTIDINNVKVDRTGKLSSFGGSFSLGVPKWTAFLETAYDQGPFEVSLQTRMVGAGKFDPALFQATGVANSINRNNYPAVFYFNVATSYILMGEADGSHLKGFFTVDNLFDRDPEIMPSGSVGLTFETSTNTSFYDAIGRTFKVGLRFAY